MNRRRCSLLGFRDVSEEIDPRLVEAIGSFFDEGFSGIRFLQIVAGTAAQRVGRAWSSRARAFAWSRSVLFPAGSEAIYAGDAEWREENARTIAHELWHVADFRRTGVIRWCGLFAREWRRHGLRQMRNAAHEIRARKAAEAFVRSEEYRDARALAIRR